MVHRDKSDPTRRPQQHIFMVLHHLGPNHADLIYHATQSLATQHLGILTNQSIHITFQALTSNVLCVCLCRYIIIYVIHQIIIIINSHQACIIKPIQHLNIYITHQNITKTMTSRYGRKSLAAAEQQAHCSDNQAHCSDKLQHLGFPNPRQLVAARTILTAVSVSCLNQPNHKSEGKVYNS